jgi:hypothetical protein
MKMFGAAGVEDHCTGEHAGGPAAEDAAAGRKSPARDIERIALCIWTKEISSPPFVSRSYGRTVDENGRRSESADLVLSTEYWHSMFVHEGRRVWETGTAGGFPRSTRRCRRLATSPSWSVWRPYWLPLPPPRSCLLSGADAPRVGEVASDLRPGVVQVVNTPQTDRPREAVERLTRSGARTGTVDAARRSVPPVVEIPRGVRWFRPASPSRRSSRALEEENRAYNGSSAGPTTARVTAVFLVMGLSPCSVCNVVRFSRRSPAASDLGVCVSSPAAGRWAGPSRPPGAAPIPC